MKQTLPGLLAHNAANWPGEIAAREKDLGIWRNFTWAQCLEATRRIALGLHALGVGDGDVVALLGQNRPQWAFGQIAAHACGAASLGVYRDSLSEEVGYLIDFCAARVVIAEDEEQVDKLLELGERIACVRHIVYCDPRGMWKHTDSGDVRLLSLERLLELGDCEAAHDPHSWDRMLAALDPDALAILCTTSGTTSQPKPAMLAAGRFLSHAAEMLKIDPKAPEDEYVSVLPLPWIGEQVALGQWLIARFRFNFCEEAETMAADMREIAPSALLWPPRAWEAMAADVSARMMDATRLKRALFALGMKLGDRAVDSGRRSWLADLLVGRALRDRLGFSRLRYATTGGAPLGPDVFRFFRAIGVPLRQVYGQTELCGVYVLHRHDRVDINTVGKPLDYVELRIDQPDRNGLGEIVVRHPGMFLGFYRNEEATLGDVRDGWMHTGDAGILRDDGELIVVDRVRDLARMSNGDSFSPQFIENKLKFSPHIGECVVLGHGREFITALLCIRYSIVSKWAEKNRLAFTTYSDLAAREEVGELLRHEVEAINAHLPPAQRVRRFFLLYKELDPDDGELTRTRKVRRNTINERYAFLIDALYEGRPVVDVDTTITLQDGRKSRIRTRMKLHEPAITGATGDEA
ncbi:MAG: long-chain fatty acid--CoA ligase [Burkholderiales bacterium]|nr:MAG: long-chain fatty acid--CoA ligase [Burkholderiales bacterium]